MKRKSLISPSDFLETVFFGNSDSSPSLSQYSASMLMNLGKQVSKQAINKRFKSNAKEFIGMLVTKVMRLQFSNLSRFNDLKSTFKQIRIMDSTEFVVSPSLSERFPGYGGKGREAMAQIQFEYELFNNNMTRLTLGNALDSDLTQGLKFLDTIPKNTLILRDLGYISLERCKQYTTRNLYFISRLKSQWAIYVRKDGKLKQWSIESIKEQLTNSKDKYLDTEVFIGCKDRVPVRLVANLLDDQQKNRRLRRKQLHRGKINQKDQINASVNIYITNVNNDQCTAEKVYELYTLRWQIELVFKTWKGVLNIHKVGPMNAGRFESLMYIKFLWILLNWSLVTLFSTATPAEISLTKITYMVRSQGFRLMQMLHQQDQSLQHWLRELFDTCLFYHTKEYKKGSSTIAKILDLNDLKSSIYV